MAEVGLMPSIIQIFKNFFKGVFGNTDAVLLHSYAMRGKVQNNGVILKVLLVQSVFDIVCSNYTNANVLFLIIVLVLISLTGELLVFCLEALHPMEATSEQNHCTSGNVYVYVLLYTLSGGSKNDLEEFRVLTQ